MRISKSGISKMKESLSHATHLNFLECRLLVRSHACRTLYSFASGGYDRSQNFVQARNPLSCRRTGEAFRGSPAVHLHGLRTIDLARGIAGYRSVPECQTRGALPLGFSRAGGKVHAGRCQRTARLALVAGFGDGIGGQGEEALCGRGFGIGFGKHDLCLGFEHDRFVDELVSLGDFPVDQERDQDSCPDRLAGTDPGLHLCVPGQPARCELVGRVGFRTGGHLPFRQGLYRFSAVVSHRRIRRVFRHPRQGQPAVFQARVSSRRQGDRGAQRPHWQTDSAQSSCGLSAAFAANPLLRRGASALFGVPDQPFGNFGVDGGPALQEALGHRVVFQVDQGESAPQALFRHKPECGENANLDRDGDLSDGGDLAQGTQIARKPQQNPADFERPSV